MSLHVSQQQTRPKSPVPSRSTEGIGPANAPTIGKTRVTKPKWTAKWTRGQFSFSRNPASFRAHRQRPAVSAPAEKLLELATALPEQAIAAPTAASSSDKGQRLTAGKQTAGEDGTEEPLSLLHTNGASPQPPNHTPSTSVANTDITMDGEAAHELKASCDAVPLNASGASGAASVPRSFDYTDLTIPSDDSDSDAADASHTVRAKVAVMHDAPPASPEAGTSTNPYSCALTPPATKQEPLPVRKQVRTELQVTKTGASREIIYIDSTDESESSSESEIDIEPEGNDDDACSPIRRLTLEESSFDMPSAKPRTMSVDVCSPEKTQDVIVMNTNTAIRESESSEDNIPLAVLRRKRLANKRRLSDDKQREVAFVNRPTPPPSQSAPIRRQRKTFDAGAFDAMIYGQSDTQPPPGVSIPRPAKALNADPHDPRIFVSANPAIHGPLVRSEKWWKDKAREIRSRPNRKFWFGKVTQRMRWLYNKQMEEEARRDAQPRGSSAARQMRQDPQPTGYGRIMDFGDVPVDQLPADVLSTPGWAKACEWYRKTREEDAAMRREVDDRTQKAWQHLQDVMKETE